MLPFRGTFEGDKQQLQELNGRLTQYLSRTQQLEQENARLIAEIARLRQARGTQWEPRCKGEMRELRRRVERLSLEKSRAEMEREKVWRELQAVQSLRSEQSEACRDVSGELKGREEELHHARRTNGELQQRLLHLQRQYEGLEEAHRREMEHCWLQAESRLVPVVAHSHRGPPVATMEEVQQYARTVSEGCMETFEMYQQKVEEMEGSIKADQERLSELQKDKILYASELDKLRAQAEKQGHAQMRLEEELVNMQEQFQVELSDYQMIIEQLEHERNLMAGTMDEKVREHQHLLQVKMSLGVEVAAYRALLEGERLDPQDAQRRVNQHQRERIIDIKLPSQSYTPRASILTNKQHMDIRYRPPTTSLSRSHGPPTGSISPSRVIPISVADRARYQSPASRRDMISFTKARAAASAPHAGNVTAATQKQAGQGEDHRSPSVQQSTSGENTVKLKLASHPDNQIGPMKSPTAETQSVRVSLSTETETEGKKQVTDEAETDNVQDSKFKDKGRSESTMSRREKTTLDSASVEEIIERAIKPAGLEANVCSSGESKVRYHVEKTEQEDGTTKTQIVLESKVEEEVDFSEDTDLDELLSQGVKKVSLEDIKHTATGSMIQNLLSDLQGAEHLQNKSVSVEILEEPVDSRCVEELEVEQTSRSTFYEPSSAYFQIEELENARHGGHVQRSDDEDDDAMKSFMTDATPSDGRSVHVEDVSRHSESPCFSHDKEPNEYFVSTPDDNLSDPEEGGGIASFDHYGIVDDLSDERYYQDEGLSAKRVIVEESDEYNFRSGDGSFVEEGFPECIIEEEVCVSPVVQESVLEFLREDSLEPKDQLKGALEQLQSSASGPLREELAFLSRISTKSPPNMSVNVKKMQQSSDNGTMTIVAELNVSQSLEDSGLLEGDDDLSEEQIMAALRSSDLGFEKGFQGGAGGGGYGFTVATEKDVVHGEEFEGFAPALASSEQELWSATSQNPVKISQEKRVIYLESPDD